jgi:hypothetical protein
VDVVSRRDAVMAWGCVAGLSFAGAVFMVAMLRLALGAVS